MQRKAAILGLHRRLRLHRQPIDSLPLAHDVTRDAADLRERLLTNQASPISYEAEKPQSLLDEDAEIAQIPLGFAEDKVSVVNSEDVFR